jgi:polyprenyl P-hydroxybenzoate/phenylacrylic acid decarboxylase-like protein
MIVGITGASGVVYGVRLLEALRELEVETHLVLTKSAALTISYELDQPLDQVKALASKVHPTSDVGASIASGSSTPRRSARPPARGPRSPAAHRLQPSDCPGYPESLGL